MVMWEGFDTPVFQNNEWTPDWTPPPKELDDGWNDADTVNENIFCPNPELWIMEMCDEQENPGPSDDDIDGAYQNSY